MLNTRDWPPMWARSIRVRLTLLYSLALFTLGAVILVAIYGGLAWALNDEPVSANLLLSDGYRRGDTLYVFTTEQAGELRVLETLVNERALEQLRTWSFGALIGLFVLSLGVGWVVAGRVVRPIGRISDVARDIEATDLSRRIGMVGPDDELTRLAGTFDNMLERLDRAFESQRRFVHDASHELRNPLATIRTNLEVSLADPDATAEDLRQMADVVVRSTERMGVVVDDLLAFARSEMPEREVRLVDMNEVCRDVAQEFAGPAGAAAVRLFVHDDDAMEQLLGSEGREVRGDPIALRRVIANLLANAIEHSPSGAEVGIGITQDRNHVTVRIVDQGPGVSTEERDRIFVRSYRGQASRIGRPGGSGLGLSIVRQVIESHGGRVWVESAGPGHGATFCLELPVASSMLAPVG